MNIKTIEGKIVNVEDLGDAVGVAETVIRNNMRIAKYQSKIAELQAQNAKLVAEGKKQSLSELTKEEKIKLVQSGIKSLKDFPGDDWLADYVVGENGV